ncbi:hypothetical protein GCM10010912_45530 [Paenibacillus albidus]|uniref:Uncharacterized protein n=1 Tax=Paenibacillus albidus TaxID=2041023 RepID=A0A917CPU1_9BACL|nr:hypothetical protein [Paenibacillus albidus]GGF95472.1 hypothetical protein GCM10010912_45530 [Paenibacillus albidus]
MRLVKRALGVCLIVVLASTLSILTTGVVVNAYVQSLLAGLDIKVDTPAPGIGGLMRTIIGMDSKPEPKKDAGDSDQATSSVQEEKADDVNEKPPAHNGETPAGETVPEDSLPVMGQASTDSAASGDGQSDSALDQQLVMTSEEMTELKDSLPSAEKVNIFNILMAKLPQEEMQKISAAMEDGLTETEVQELKQVIAKYVDPDEYDTLLKMLTPTEAATP